MTAESDRVLGHIDAVLAGVGGVAEDFTVSVDAMRWAIDQPPTDTLQPGAWSDAILAEARSRHTAIDLDVTMQREWTPAEINQFLEEWSALFPPHPTVLRCHPSVLHGLVALTGQQPGNWPSIARPDLVRIEIIADSDMPAGAWELRRGDEIVDQGVIAVEATA